MKKLYYNAKFFSMESESAIYQAVLCDDGKITEVYSEEPAGIDCEKIDLQGGFVFPSFIDAHTHSFEGGLYQKGADLSQCETLDDALDCIAGATPLNGMIFAWRLDENRFSEPKFPERYHLNKLFPTTPVIVRRVDGHTCIINDAAEKLIRKKKGGSLPNLPENGLLKGELNDIAAHTFHSNLSEDIVIDCYLAAEKIALANGHTGLHSMIGDAQNDFLHFPALLARRNDFTIDFTFYPQCFDIKRVQKVYADLQPKKQINKIGGCILADGSIGSFTAAVTQSYEGHTHKYGKLYQSQKFWNKFISDAHLADLQTAVHCIGDRAIAQIIDAVELSHKVIKKDIRHMIIHCELVRDDMINGIKANNIFPVMQPMFDALWGGETGFYSRVLGSERASILNRFKTLTDKGIIIAGSSDWYITE
ncbi:MAG: amidohydrolase family protein, partial [Candidatus Cloacimonetes bacterium]|nr:amidohydrolase family protein [Candidatus Cloacimonadota bacterium]